MRCIPRLALSATIVCSGLFPAAAQESEAPTAPAPDQEQAPGEPDDGDTEDEDEPAPPPADLPEIPEPPSSLPDAPADDDAGDELSLSDWERDDWMLLQPELSLVELNGYFRVRSQMFRRLNFGNSELGAEDPSRFEVNEEVTTDPENPNDREDVNLAGTDLRLRLEPVINVTEKVQIVTTFDIFDNLVAGSTPLSSPFFREEPDGLDARRTPVNILNRSQGVPEAGYNAVRDAILVRRAYARLTALNDQLQFDIGRMPDHWGLGMMINDGNCLDCDFGDVVDRAIVGFKAVGHLFQVGITLVDTGPTFSPFYDQLGPVYDRARWDDVDQYDIRAQKVDHPDDIRERVLQGETVVNYGLLNAFRLQKNGLNFQYYDTETFDPSAPLNTTGDGGADLYVRENRGGFLYIGDAFVRLWSGPWLLEAEAAAMIGNFEDRLLDPEGSETTIQMFGGYFNLAHSFNPAPRNGATLSLRGAAASGDRGRSGLVGRGFGVLDRTDTQRGSTAAGDDDDDTLSAFQFSPDFHLDQLLFRRVIGTFSDAWMVGPQLQYFFDNSAEARLAVNYAQTWFNRNTPGDGLGLGVEVDTELIFGAPSKTASGGEIFASAQASLLFPLDGFSPAATDDTGGGAFAWSIQARLFLTF